MLRDVDISMVYIEACGFLCSVVLRNVVVLWCILRDVNFSLLYVEDCCFRAFGFQSVVYFHGCFSLLYTVG